MEALKKAGFRVVPVTGRPAGWCDHIARFWPVDAVVGENGAFWMWHDHQAGKLRTRFIQSEAERADGRRRLEAVRAHVLREVPGSGIASDQPYRAADLAIDFCEDVPPLPPCRDRPHRDDLRGARRPRQGELDPRQRLVRRLRQAHHQPADDARAVRRRSRGRRASATCSPAIRPTTRRCSASSPMPSAWPTCATSPADMDHLPRWITTARSGAGFVELARALIAARR